jgi:pimeloyl-ACP methyl ester carboxylesterase
MIASGGLIGLLSFVNSTHAITNVPSDIDPTCCSSVLFIPGIKGTRLYADRPSDGVGTTTHRFWEPLSNADVVSLHFTHSVPDMRLVSGHAGIYSGKPIGKAYGFVDIYGKFMNFMDDLQNSKVINEWKAFGYDWRYPVDKIVMEMESKGTTTESLIETFSEMAKRSRTGKVTIVAHSNGGLIAKYLTKKLSEMGKGGLIDSVVSVAVPFLGTPETIGALLHGDGQSIGKGLIVNQERSRGLAGHLPSVFGLLPSKQYFREVFSPTIAFASTTVKNVNNGTIPLEIKTYQDQYNFIVDSEDTRDFRKIYNTSIPLEGNIDILRTAEIIHGILDPYSWPQTIARWAITGWNKATTKGIVYDEKTVCNAIRCSTSTIHNASTTLMGDGTVVVPSAVYNAGEIISIDLDKISEQEERDIAHGNMMGASSTIAIVKDIITHSNNSVKQEVFDNISKIPGVTLGKPDYTKESSFLVLRTHSPVELHVYDSKGNHTGLIPKPAEFADVEDGLFTYYDEGIVGSKFTNIGGSEEDPEYQIYLPDDTSEQYSVVLNGTGLGKFTFDIERVRNGSYLEKVQFSSLPVTPLTTVKTTVVAGKESGSIVPIASTTEILSIDIDGNGTIDISATTKTKISEKDYLEMLKKIVVDLLGNSPKSKNILARIDKLEALIVSGKLIDAKESSSKLNSWINHINRRTLSETEKEQIIDMINLYISQYE